MMALELKYRNDEQRLMKVILTPYLIINIFNRYLLSFECLGCPGCLLPCSKSLFQVSLNVIDSKILDWLVTMYELK